MAMFCIWFLKMWKGWLILVRHWVTSTLSVQLYVSYNKYVRVFHQPSLWSYETPQLLPGTPTLSQASAASVARHFQGPASLLEGVSAPVHELAHPSASSTWAAPLLLASLPWEKAPGMWVGLPAPIPITLQTPHNCLGWGGTKSRTKVLKCWILKLLFLWQHKF